MVRRAALSRPALGALVALLALTAAACNPGRPPAIVVEGRSLSVEHVDAVVAAYQEADPDLFANLDGEGQGTTRIAAALPFVQTLAIQMFQAHLAEEEGAIVSQEEREEAKTLVAESFVSQQDLPPEAQVDPTELSKAVYDALPSETRDLLVELRASTLALARVMGSQVDYEELARAAYDADPNRYDVVCLSVIFVEVEDVPVAEERLAAGEDFGAVSADMSVDPAIAEADGVLGECQQVAGYSEFLVALVSEMAVGDVSEPQSIPADPSTGQPATGVIVKLDERVPTPFEQVADQLGQTLQEGGAAAEAETLRLVEARLPEADIRIDPRFGTWNPATASIVPNDATQSILAEPADVEPAPAG